MGYSDYANNTAAIYRDMGRAQAEARLQRGNAWGGAIQNIGQMAAAIPGQLQQQKLQDQDSKRQALLTDLTQAQLDQARAGIAASKRATEVQMLVPGLVKSSTVNGVFNPELFTQSALANGVAADDISDINKVNADTAKAIADGEERIRKGQLDGLALADAQKKAWQPIAMGIVERGFTPESIQTGLALAEANRIPKETIDFYRNMDPDDFIAATLSAVPRPEAPKPFDVAQGAQHHQPVVDQFGRAKLDANGQPVMTVIEGAPKPESLDDQLAAAVKARNGAEVSRLRNEMMRNAAATRAPERDSFTPKRVLKQDGTVGPANYNSRTGQFIDPETRQVLPNAMEVTESGVTSLENKGKLAAIVNRMNELSEKINMSEGLVATARGVAAQQAAKVNLDNDVAEYEALVSVYTPIVARANGHTGVLTQIDVDSTKAGFPSARDSKSLRDRKVKIMTEIQGAGNLTRSPSSGAPVSVTIGGQTFAFPNQTAADAFKKKAGGG